jgi:hypothetical protein
VTGAVTPIGGEELHHLRTILDRTKPAKRDQLGSIAIALDAAGYDRRHDPPGGDYAGGYAVHRDPERPEILG